MSATVSGLSPEHRLRARQLGLRAAYLGLHNAPALHYTQNAYERWEGIRDGLKAYRGQFPHHADCSAFATWVIWNGLSHYGAHDTVNGAGWRYGYTGSMVEHGKQVHDPRNIKWLDLALYGDPYGGSGHVAVCVGGGKVISFGSEAGPFLLPIRYRGDLHQVRRYI